MIKKMILFVISFIPTALFAASIPTHLNGKELLTYCEVAMDVFDRNMGRVQTENEFLQGTKAGICEGYIMSVNEIMSSHKQSKDNFCVPDNLIMLEVISAVVKFLKNHTELQQLPASTVVMKTYQTYFRC